MAGELLAEFWHYCAIALTLAVSGTALGHTVIFKRDTRSAVLWSALIIGLPLVGSTLYLLFGINRVRRRAFIMRGELEHYLAPLAQPPCSVAQIESHLKPKRKHLSSLARMIDRVSDRPLLSGNAIAPLVNGDAAFPAMLEAIRRAKVSISLATYIFDSKDIGEQFVDSLSKAHRRGVHVRVLVDSTGARYSFPTVLGKLRAAQIPHARFLPSFAAWRPLTLNLHNHRKLLVVDGRSGFTGGMNIRQGNLLQTNPKHPVQDLHFGVEGPVVAQLQEAFSDDWCFSTRERLSGKAWFPKIRPRGEIIARGISDGPDEDLDKLNWAILSALSTARESVYVMTPYFLPDAPVISALNLAALRGVDVNIILPEQSNLPFVQWATFGMLWQVLQYDCKLWLTPPPFDHSKIMVVDGGWAMIGSTNWDPRSLRLNFEFNLECYDRGLGGQLEKYAMAKVTTARRLDRREIDARSIPIKLRDGIARLASPYL